jgi:hypothetical protein
MPRDSPIDLFISEVSAATWQTGSVGTSSPLRHLIFILSSADLGLNSHFRLSLFSRSHHLLPILDCGQGIDFFRTLRRNRYKPNLDNYFDGIQVQSGFNVDSIWLIC